jgi:hypothetical protein
MEGCFCSHILVVIIVAAASINSNSNNDKTKEDKTVEEYSMLIQQPLYENSISFRVFA